MEKEEYTQLCPAVLGLQRIESCSSPRTPTKRKVEMPILNRRGMPPRIRKKNSLFDNETYIVDEFGSSSKSADLCSPLKINKTPTKCTPEPKKETVPVSQRSVVSLSERQQKIIAHSTGLRLKNLLKLSKAFRWACSEFLYSNIDRPIFHYSDNDFQICMKESFPIFKEYSFNRVEWCMIRRMLGKPRRCSETFYNEERKELNRRRGVIRNLQRGQYESLHTIKDIPNILTLEPEINSRVSARLYGKHDGMFSGTIDAIDNSKNGYLINFDNPSLGVRFIPDIDLTIDAPFVKTINKNDIINTIYRKTGNGGFKFGKRIIREIKAIKENAPPIEAPKMLIISPEIDRSLLLLDDKEESINSVIHHEFDGPEEVVESTPNNSVLESEDSDLVTIISRFERLLDYKKSQLQVLRHMHTEMERLTLYEKEPDSLFRANYAAQIIKLDNLNHDLSNIMNELNKNLESLVSVKVMNSLNAPVYLRNHTTNIAMEMVQKHNESLSEKLLKPVVHDKPILEIIRDFTALLLQVKYISENECNDYLVDVLKKSVNDVKQKLVPRARILFENTVEVQMQHIQAGLMNRPNFVLDANNKNESCHENESEAMIIDK